MEQCLEAGVLAPPAARKLPEPIIRARDLLSDPGFRTDLSVCARRAMHAVLRYASATQLKRPIFARHEELLRDFFLQSLSTLRRGIAELKDKGWLDGDQRRRVNSGRYSTAQYILTDKALALLMLDKGPAAQAVALARPCTGNVRGARNISAHIGDPANQVAPGHNPEIDEASRIPRTLVRLLDLGVAKSLVCKLMRVAKQRGTLLEDVVGSTWSSLIKLRGMSVYLYLRKLLSLDRDWKMSRDATTAVPASAQSDGKVQQRMQTWARLHDQQQVKVAEGRSGRINAEGMRVEGDGWSVPINRTTFGSLCDRVKAQPSAGTGPIAQRLSRPVHEPDAGDDARGNALAPANPARDFVLDAIQSLKSRLTGIRKPNGSKPTRSSRCDRSLIEDLLGLDLESSDGRYVGRVEIDAGRTLMFRISNAGSVTGSSTTAPPSDTRRPVSSTLVESIEQGYWRLPAAWSGRQRWFDRLRRS